MKLLVISTLLALSSWQSIQASTIVTATVNNGPPVPGDLCHFEALLNESKSLFHAADLLNSENGVVDYPHFFTLPGNFYNGLRKVISRMDIMMQIINATEETKDQVRDTVNANGHQLGLSGVILFKHFLEERTSNPGDSAILAPLYRKLAEMEPQLVFLKTNLAKEMDFVRSTKKSLEGQTLNAYTLASEAEKTIQKGGATMQNFFSHYSIDIPYEDERILLSNYTTKDGRFTFIPNQTLQALAEEIEILDDFSNDYLMAKQEQNQEASSPQQLANKQLLVKMFAQSVDFLVTRLNDFLETKMDSKNKAVVGIPSQQ